MSTIYRITRGCSDPVDYTVDELLQMLVDDNPDMSIETLKVADWNERSLPPVNVKIEVWCVDGIIYEGKRKDWITKRNGNSYNLHISPTKIHLVDYTKSKWRYC